MFVYKTIVYLLIPEGLHHNDIITIATRVDSLVIMWLEWAVFGYPKVCCLLCSKLREMGIE